MQINDKKSPFFPLIRQKILTKTLFLTEQNVWTPSPLKYAQGDASRSVSQSVDLVWGRFAPLLNRIVSAVRFMKFLACSTRFEIKVWALARPPQDSPSLRLQLVFGGRLLEGFGSSSAFYRSLRWRWAGQVLLQQSSPKPWLFHLCVGTRFFPLCQTCIELWSPNGSSVQRIFIQKSCLCFWRAEASRRWGLSSMSSSWRLFSGQWNGWFQIVLRSFFKFFIRSQKSEFEKTWGCSNLFLTRNVPFFCFKK